MEWKRKNFRIVDDPAEIRTEVVARLLAGTYWGDRRPRRIIEKLIQNSLCFGLFSEDAQIGFARVATDFTVFSWLSDLVIDDEYRNQGLGKWLIQCVLQHPSIAHTQFVLQTRTAHDFYEAFGFERNERLMTRMPTATKPGGMPEG